MLKDDALEFQVAAMSSTLSDRTFVSAMISKVNVSGITSGNRSDSVDTVTLARKWGIGLPAAKKTLGVTTQ